MGGVCCLGLFPKKVDFFYAFPKEQHAIVVAKTEQKREVNPSKIKKVMEKRDAKNDAEICCRKKCDLNQTWRDHGSFFGGAGGLGGG